MYCGEILYGEYMYVLMLQKCVHAHTLMYSDARLVCVL